MCPFDMACSRSKCVKKFSGSIGAPCQSYEQCNLFDGVACDKMAGICKKDQYSGHDCYMSSECGTGECRCNGESKKCVSYGSALPIPACRDLFYNVSQCIINNGCTRMLNGTCPQCYMPWMCYRYTCYAAQAWNPLKSALASMCGELVEGGTTAHFDLSGLNDGEVPVGHVGAGPSFVDNTNYNYTADEQSLNLNSNSNSYFNSSSNAPISLHRVYSNSYSLALIWLMLITILIIM
ncbi:hypothetical protein SAMD00019534_104900 [Acytostelium subglobosum LB1]|uniref:hypothetical protein n=1 Tax=Acytostelium subglobosum LB1 TaxID=1410327 RepID=UPI000644F57E|nr:hypothetical protein SAMD00019534_104900 [Acytostelium subglobosum LB1]GAM27315.1 hypothetical protein SAMD00019534_104900 [Acytostelium subglobosum LB1]|eukprot:XP_012749782.1 hypothetical protein SAMD00019534_104900 [Acytostelium subglobosum LB1]